MKILIVSTFFPPQNSIASLRPYTWAKYWSREGHDVTVLTVQKLPHSSDSPMPMEGFSVVSLPIPGLMGRIGSRLKKVDYPSPSAKIEQKAYRKNSQILKLIYWAKRRYGIYSNCRMPEVTDAWAKLALTQASKEDWDLVVSSAWPYSVHRVGYGLKRQGKTKLWVMDWRDLWTGNHMYPGLPIIRWWEQRMERQFHSQADMVTTVSEPLAAQLITNVGNKVHVIYNGFDPEDYTALSGCPAFPDDGLFRIVYTGSIYSGKQDPTPLFTAIKNLHDSKKVTPNQLKVVFVGVNSDVTDLAKRSHVDEYVAFQGLVPRERALRMQRDCDALLFLEYQAPGVDGILTGKLFEYLFVQPPILAIGISSQSSAGVIIEQSERGVALGNDVGKIEQWLLLQLQNSAAQGRIERKGQCPATILKYSRENAARELLSLVSKL